jgi:hypothetical protein
MVNFLRFSSHCYLIFSESAPYNCLIRFSLKFSTTIPYLILVAVSAVVEKFKKNGTKKCFSSFSRDPLRIGGSYSAHFVFAKLETTPGHGDFSEKCFSVLERLEHQLTRFYTIPTSSMVFYDTFLSF